MNGNAVTVVYKWTAKPGQFQALTDIYRSVTDAMKANEPGALAVQVYASEADSAIYVRDEFADAKAVAFHLQETAGPHFPSLLDVATPGAFYFFGDLPEDLKHAIQGMGLDAEFSSSVAGFTR